MAAEDKEESTTPARQIITDNPLAKIMQISKAPDYYIDYMNKTWGVKRYNLGHNDYCWTCAQTYDMVFDTEQDMYDFIKSIFEIDPED